MSKSQPNIIMAQNSRRTQVKLPYRTKVFIGINVREIPDCQNREGFKPTKNNYHQALHACKQHQIV